MNYFTWVLLSRWPNFSNMEVNTILATSRNSGFFSILLYSIKIPSCLSMYCLRFSSSSPTHRGQPLASCFISSHVFTYSAQPFTRLREMPYFVDVLDLHGTLSRSFLQFGCTPRSYQNLLVFWVRTLERSLQEGFDHFFLPTACTKRKDKFAAEQEGDFERCR